MRLTVDHHVHTKYSGCCREKYDLADVAEKQSANGMRYVCVSDHIHTAADDGGLPGHFALLDSGNRNFDGVRVYVGTELTFISEKGDVPACRNQGTRIPAYAIGGCHNIPWNKKLTMGSIEGSRAELAHFSDDMLLDLFRKHHAMLTGAVTERNMNILAHPYDIFFRFGIFDSRQLDMFPEIARTCALNGVAVEINEASARRCFSANQNKEPFNRHCMEPEDFFRSLLRISLDEGALLSPASDAHSLSDVGKMPLTSSLFEESGVTDRNIFCLETGRG